MAKRILKQILKNGNEYEVGNLKAYTVTEDKTTVTTEATQGVSPYDTSYGYTNITIDESSGIKWKEGAIYSFVVNTEMVVDSSKRNVRVRIGSNGSWIPVMNGAGTILNGNEFMKKSNTVLFVYKTTYQSTGALHSIYSSLSGLPAGGQPGQMIMMTSNGAVWVNVQSPTAISLDESSIQLNTTGATKQLTATVTPSTAVVTQVDWSSSDTTIATVSSSGLVTCVTPGNATITASTVNGLTATCSVTEGGRWTPGANTVLYVPMNTNLADHGPNNISLTNTNVTLATVGGVSAGLFPAIDDYYNLAADLSSYISSGDYTVLVWVNALELPTGSNPTPFTSIWGGMATNPYRGGTMTLTTGGFQLGCEGYSVQSSAIPTLNTWYLICGVYKSNEGILYVNGTQEATNSWTLSYGFSGFGIGRDWNDNDGKRRHRRGYMSNFILEDKARTAQEISDYYDQTKGDYGIS